MGACYDFPCDGDDEGGTNIIEDAEADEGVLFRLLFFCAILA